MTLDGKNKRTVTWLHLSDLHLCNPRTGWEADYILEKLRDDFARLQEQYQLKPDLIFFTGDVVFGHLGDDGGWRPCYIHNKTDDNGFWETAFGKPREFRKIPEPLKSPEPPEPAKKLV